MDIRVCRLLCISILLLLSVADHPVKASANPRASSVDTIGAPILDMELPASPKEDTSGRNRVRGSGGLVAADINGDDRFDFIVSRSGSVTAVSTERKILWHHDVDIQITKMSENDGLPGLHGPGVQATDIDGDGQLEVFYLTQSGYLHIVSGENGRLIKPIYLPSPPGTDRWEHLVISNFRGKGDLDILLQTTNSDGYRMGRYIAAFSIEALMNDHSPQPLWQRDDFIAAAHNGARVADLDGDGLDEVISGSIIGPDGKKLYDLPLRGHVDSVQIADVLPSEPGLEVVALEEGGDFKGIPIENSFVYKINWHLNRWWMGGNRVFLFNSDGLLWQTHHKRIEPQNSAVGEFDINSAGLEIWCRSRFDTGQKPFVLDARGDLLTTYALQETGPADWTPKGIEVITPIFWDDRRQLLAAKARHQSGDVAIMEPLTGEFVARIPEKADRLYIADVIGDWREEIVVLSRNRLRVYSNTSENISQDQPRLWEQAVYRRLKQTWNYYSP